MIAEDSDVIVRRWLDNDFYVANFNAIYKNKNLEVNSGVSYSHYTGDHFGEVIWGSDLTEDVSIRDVYYFSDATRKQTFLFSVKPLLLLEISYLLMLIYKEDLLITKPKA